MEASIPTNPTKPARERNRLRARVALTIAGLTAVAALGLICENLRAQRELSAYRAKLIASGEKLDLAAHIPTLPTASSNGAAGFMVAPKFTPLPIWLQLQHPIVPGRACVAWQQEKRFNSKTNVWPSMAAHLTTNAAAFAAMWAVSEYPKLEFSPDYGKGFEANLPHLERIGESTRQLAYAAVTTLQAGDRQGALNHLLAGVRLLGRFREPIRISQSVRTSCSRELMQATWELLQAPSWTDEQLDALQGAWQEWKILDDSLAAIQMERTTFTTAFTRCRAEPGLMVGECLCSGEPSWDCKKEKAQRLALAYVWKFSFSHHDELWSLRHYQQLTEHIRAMSAADQYRPPGSRFDLQPFPPGPRILTLSGMQLPAYHDADTKLATFETSRRLTVTAIALHRHRQRHQAFPAALEALVPEFLSKVPRDFMDGQPLRYRRTADGQFQLWSVGRDLKDDGGEPAGLNGRAANWLFGRDWVWPQAATQAEVDATHAARAALEAANTTTSP